GRPLAALPNVGLASLSGGRVIYPHATPEYFAEFAAQARALGARVIGGCCGTTPTEIAAIARAVEEERQPTVPFAAAERELLAAHAEGVRNVLAVTGDPPHVGDYPGSRGVYEVDSIGLSQVVSRLNAGEDFNGKAIDAPTSFFLGVAVNPSADDLETELDRFRRKVEAGAQLAMTQALFDLAYLDHFEDRLGGWPIPVLVGIFMVRSHQLAVRLHNEVPGIVVPEDVQNRLRDAGPRAAGEGLALARELYAQAREKAAGVYVIPPFKQPEAALELL